MKAFDGKFLNQTGWTELWIWAIDARADRHEYNNKRMLMVGYGGDGPNIRSPWLLDNFFRRTFSVYSNESEQIIKYIGLYCPWGSFQYEILNGKL